MKLLIQIRFCHGNSQCGRHPHRVNSVAFVAKNEDMLRIYVIALILFFPERTGGAVASLFPHDHQELREAVSGEVGGVDIGNQPFGVGFVENRCAVKKSGFMVFQLPCFLPAVAVGVNLPRFFFPGGPGGELGFDGSFIRGSFR